MQEDGSVFIHYDRGTGDLVIDWDHGVHGYYEAVEQEDGPAWVSIKRHPDTDEPIGLLVENFDTVAERGAFTWSRTGQGFSATANVPIEFDVDE